MLSSPLLNFQTVVVAHQLLDDGMLVYAVTTVVKCAELTSQTWQNAVGKRGWATDVIFCGEMDHVCPQSPKGS